MKFRTVTYLLAVATLISHSAGELIITPCNTETKVGDTTYFNCSTNAENEEIFWYHGEEYIYNGFGILEPYDERFEIDRNASNGSHNLVIHLAEPSDAGEYICIDQHGLGRRRSAELVVLDNDPDCQSDIQPDGIIGQNIFNIPRDEAQLTCNVSHYGNIPPLMEWKNVADYSSVEHSVTTNVASDNRFISLYTLKIKGDISLDNSTFVCQTKRSTKNQYKCASETIRVLYFIRGNMTEQKVFRGDEITCTTTRNTLSCIHQWHYGNKTFGETIATNLLGEYLCTVKCHVRGIDYSFDALKSIVAERTTSPSSLSSSAVTAAIVVPIIVIILVVSIAALTVNHIKRRKGKPVAENKQSMSSRGINDNHPANYELELRLISGSDARNIQAIGERKEDLERGSDARNIQAIGERMEDLERGSGARRFQAILERMEGLERGSDARKIQAILERMEDLERVSITCSDASSQTDFEQLEERPREICGMAMLAQQVFILHKECPDIEVYDSTTFYFKRRMSLNGMTYPQNIASCSVNNRLYVSDRHYNDKRPAILKIDPDNGNLVKICDLYARGGRISIAGDTNVIFIANGEALLYEYTADGKLIRKINLKPSLRVDFNDCLYAVKLPNGLFAVGHGYCYESHCKVYLISIKGTKNSEGEFNESEILVTYVAEKTELMSRSEKRVYLSLRKDDFILFSCGSYNQVILLSYNLKELQIIVTEEHSIGLPLATCFDELTGQWFVADRGCVMAYRVKEEGVERKRYVMSGEEICDAEDRNPSIVAS